MDNPYLSTQAKTNTELATEALNNLKGALYQQAQLYLYIARYLKMIRDNRLYQFMGIGGYDDFEMFVKNADIKIGVSTAYLYIRVYEYFLERLGLTDEEILRVPISRLQVLLPELKKRPDEDARKIVINMGFMTNPDYVATVEEEQLISPRPHLHRCKVCAKWQLESKDDQMCTGHATQE